VVGCEQSGKPRLCGNSSGSVPTREKQFFIVLAVVQQSGRLIMERATFIPVYNLADIYGSARNLVWKKRAVR